jgi:hypothetical protein
VVICEAVWWGHAYECMLLLLEPQYSGLQGFKFNVILRSTEHIFNSRSQHGSCCGSFILYEPCLRNNAPTAATVLRPELEDVFCSSSSSSSNGFQDRSTPQRTFELTHGLS